MTAISFRGPTCTEQEGSSAVNQRFVIEAKHAVQCRPASESHMQLRICGLDASYGKQACYFQSGHGPLIWACSSGSSPLALVCIRKGFGSLGLLPLLEIRHVQNIDSISVVSSQNTRFRLGHERLGPNCHRETRLEGAAAFRTR